VTPPEWRKIYRAAVLIPLAGLAIAAVLHEPPPRALPAGWNWLYPDSITRGLLAYALVAVWLWILIGRRSLAEVDRILWLAPLVYVGILWLMLLGPALARGRVAELWEENAGAIVLRAAVHLMIGYACVALLHVARRRLAEREGAG
jgi:hypothetical protein